ncbi:PhnE/PtxC family ABC transporter permease [Lyngbya confervoides]|uniref:ABC transporter permease subunit n=1 Tax=Lyngbya confervoides BDU141951 TaxID=1574623 RepID=A0ABD4T4T9_9CYAN|nr:ABC transporter permease subunit [Lyngbya confervoides]MCM1983365.1 ABC transporter permease subunit [Lyngbya confervoides BDU141951]
MPAVSPKIHPLQFWFPPTLRNLVGLLIILGLAGAIALAPDFEVINPYGWPQFWAFIQASGHPDLSPAFLTLTLQATWTTLSYALVGTAMSLGLGVLGASLTSDVIISTLAPSLAHWGIQRWGRAILALPRSLHEVIWGLLLINLLGLDPLVGLLAIAIPYGAIVAKIFAEILDDTPQSALQSILQSGAPPALALIYGLLPQASLSLLSYSFYRFECSLRSAAILGVIGAGGLGYQMMLSLQSLRYAQIWTLFYAIVLLNGMVDLLSAHCRHRIRAPPRMHLKDPLRLIVPPTQAPQAPSPGLGAWGSLILTAVILALTGAAWVSLAPDLSLLGKPPTVHLGAQMTARLFPVQLPPELVRALPWGVVQTLSMGSLAIAIATLGAFGLSWSAARSWGKSDLPRVLSPTRRLRILVSHGILLFMRAIPSPIWALVLLYLLRPGITVGAIALGLHNAGVMGRLFAEEIENCAAAPMQALQNAGVPLMSSLVYGLFSRIGSRFAQYGFYRLEVCIRESFVLGLVGAGGLGVLLREELSNYSFQPVLLLLLCFSGLTLAIEWISRGVKSNPVE